VLPELVLENEQAQQAVTRLERDCLAYCKSDDDSKKAQGNVTEFIASTLSGTGGFDQNITELQAAINLVLFHNWDNQVKIKSLFKNRLFNFCAGKSEEGKTYRAQTGAGKIGIAWKYKGKEKLLAQSHFAHEARTQGLFTPNDVKQAFQPIVLTLAAFEQADSEPESESDSEPEQAAEFDGIKHLLNAFEVVQQKIDNGSCTMSDSELAAFDVALAALTA
jgi:hypothetical protein